MHVLFAALLAAALATSAPRDVAGPVGWTADPPRGPAVLAAFHQTFAGSNEVVEATVFNDYATLDDFILRNSMSLGAENYRLESESRTRVCGGDRAWETVSTHVGKGPDGHALTFRSESVSVVVAHRAYVAAYVRAEGAPRRDEAVRWIHGFCLRL